MVGYQYLVAQVPDYHLQQFGYSSGIRPGNIVALTKDQKGFLWILYARSVQRFDGSRVQEFQPGTDLTHIVCDKNGRLWINSFKKVYFFDETIQQFVEAGVQATSSNINYGSVFTMPGKAVMLSTDNGIYSFDSSKHVFIPALINIPSAHAVDVRTFANYHQTIFFRSGKYLHRYIAGSSSDSLPDKGIKSVFPINEDSVIVQTWNLASYWYNFTKHTITEMPVPANREPLNNAGLKKFGVRDVKKAGEHIYFITSTHGLFLFDSKKNDFQPVSLFDNGTQILTSDYTSYLYADDEHFLWMTNANGIARFPVNGQSFGLLRIAGQDRNLSPLIDNIRGITGDGKDDLWLATANGFVNFNRNKKRFQIYLPQEESNAALAFPSVRGIAMDGKYIILGPSNLGIWLFDPVTRKYRRPVYDSLQTQQISEQDFIDGITTLQNGHHVITGRDAIYLLDGKTYTLRRVHNPAAKENSNFCFQSPDGHIWITTQSGLHLFDKDLQYLQKAVLPPVRQLIRAGFATPDNRFLFSLDDGLYIASIDNGNIRVKKRSPVFDHIFISSLFQDAAGYIWATSDNGIYRYDTLRGKLLLFDYTDNVQGYGFNLNSSYYSKDGTLFFGGNNGLNYLDPKKISESNDHLKVYISYIKNFNDSVIYAISTVQSFSYRQRAFEIGLAAPYFNNAGKVQYRYRLTGFDETWKMIGNNNMVRFTSLPSGKYHFEVQASINNVDWVNAVNSFYFKILPPFWMTWWFIVLCVIAFIAFVGLILYNRNKRLRVKQTELETEQAINHFSASMYQQQTLEELLRDVAKNCIDQLDFENCVIYVLDEKTGVLYQKAAYDEKYIPYAALSEPLIIEPGHGITGHAAKTGKAIIVKNTSLDERYIADGKKRLSEIAVPIIAESKVLGVIDCEHSKKSFFTQRHMNILQTIASLCGSMIVKMNAETEKLAAEKSLTETKQKMADVEMQALRAQMNPHFIFNSLNSINRYIVKSDQATASLYLTRFAKLIRLILDNSNSSYITLASELEALQLYIEIESIRFEKKFSYTIITDKELHPGAIYVPPLLIQPYVENAIWHGLLNKPSAGHLDIRVSAENEGMMKVIITDNGIGRAMAKNLKQASGTTRKSLGLKLTEERLSLLNQHGTMKSSVEIEDLYDSSGEANGTKVTIRIPIEE